MKAEKKIKKIIFQSLNPKDYQVFVFGSRANRKAKKFSDYDIGIWGKKQTPAHIISEIKENLEESDLPYKVDIVDFSLTTEDFRKIALSKIKELKP